MDARTWPKAVLFDLDGTLVHSAPDLHEALNETLEGRGEPPFTLEAVAGMIGGGIPKLIERAFEALDKELDPAERDRLVDRFRTIYGPRATRLTTLCAGAGDAARALGRAGMPIGVVSNKPAAETGAILAHFGLAGLMAVVVGGDAGPDRKPAPGLLLLACRQLGLEPADAVFVGDSENDVDAAKAAGMPVVAVRGGYTRLAADALGADRLIDRLDALPDALKSLAEERSARCASPL